MHGPALRLRLSPPAHALLTFLPPNLSTFIYLLLVPSNIEAIHVISIDMAWSMTPMMIQAIWGILKKRDPKERGALLILVFYLPFIPALVVSKYTLFFFLYMVVDLSIWIMKYGTPNPIAGADDPVVLFIWIKLFRFFILAIVLVAVTEVHSPIPATLFYLLASIFELLRTYNLLRQRFVRNPRPSPATIRDNGGISK